jgi:hypothetical protein
MSDFVTCLLFSIPPAVWLGLLIVALWMRGPKLDGIISVVAAVVGNVETICFMRAHLYLRPPPGELFCELSVSLVAFGTWLGFAIIAIKAWRLPNSLIGGLSLALVVSPGVLDLVQGYLWVMRYWT